MKIARRLLTLALLFAAVALLAAAPAEAAGRHHAAHLPAVHVVQPYCTATGMVDGHARYRHTRYVHFELLALGYTSDPRGVLRYVIEATTGPRHPFGRHLAHGWHRFNRHTATYTFDVLELPACEFAGEAGL